MSRVVAALLLACPSGVADDPRCDVRMLERDGEKLCSVRADEAPLTQVIAAIADGAGLHIENAETPWTRTRVSIELRERPWRRALDFVLGSVGLRAEVRGDALVLRDDVGAGDEAGALFEAALASYLRVERDFPDHELANRAMFAQAEVETARGNLAAARAQCEALLERRPNAELTPRVLALAAELATRERAWDRSFAFWSDLLRTQPELDVETHARRELARASTMLGHHERALTMLDALETLGPARDDEDRAVRQLIRARAFAGLGRGVDALQLVDDLAFDEHDQPELLELRALATEAAERPTDAARAWLAFAGKADVYASACALDSAARLALEADDELGALFVERLARSRGLEIGAHTAREARARLGLDDSAQLVHVDAAERALAANAPDEALAQLLAVLPARDELDEDAQLRFDLAYARALDATAGADAALAHLRSLPATLANDAARRRVYVLAGELCERAERFDDAIDAYRGRL